MTIILSKKQIRALGFYDGEIDSSFIRRTQRKARLSRALNIKRFQLLSYTQENIGEDIHYITTDGGHLIIGKNHVAIKLPHGLSANQIWRAKITDNGGQTNQLSLGARNYKKNVVGMYAELLRKIDFQRITNLCEVRLIVQPPKRDKKYNKKTYPRYDIDNYPKLIIDSLKGLIFKDDNLFVDEAIQLAKPVDEGCVWLSCVIKNQEQTNWLDRDVNFPWLFGKES